MNRLSPIAQQLVVEVLSPFQPAVIYLFGSHGTDAEHSGSDMDFAFLPAVPVDVVTCFSLAGELADVLGKPVDLVNLRQCSTVMAKEVLRTGVALHTTDEKRRREFEMYTLSDYARLNEERHEILARQR